LFVCLFVELTQKKTKKMPAARRRQKRAHALVCARVDHVLAVKVARHAHHPAHANRVAEVRVDARDHCVLVGNGHYLRRA
jgi:hypothetical protein